MLQAPAGCKAAQWPSGPWTLAAETSVEFRCSPQPRCHGKACNSGNSGSRHTAIPTFQASGAAPGIHPYLLLPAPLLLPDPAARPCWRYGHPGVLLTPAFEIVLVQAGASPSATHFNVKVGSQACVWWCLFSLLLFFASFFFFLSFFLLFIPATFLRDLIRFSPK